MILIETFYVAMYCKVLYRKSMEQFYTSSQIAKTLGVSTITVRRWISKGILPAISLDKGYRVKQSDFEKFVAERKVNK